MEEDTSAIDDLEDFIDLVKDLGLRRTDTVEHVIDALEQEIEESGE